MFIYTSIYHLAACIVYAYIYLNTIVFALQMYCINVPTTYSYITYSYNEYV